MSARETNPTLQSQSVNVLPNGETSRVTESGDVVRSEDPSTHPNASMSQKLKGDFKGAMNGTIGSTQAAFGNMTGNEKMKQTGMDKMSAEDQRLGAKHGVMPVGSDRRETDTEAKTT